MTRFSTKPHYIFGTVAMGIALLFSSCTTKYPKELDENELGKDPRDVIPEGLLASMESDLFLINGTEYGFTGSPEGSSIVGSIFQKKIASDGKTAIFKKYVIKYDGVVIGQETSFSRNQVQFSLEDRGDAMLAIVGGSFKKSNFLSMIQTVDQRYFLKTIPANLDYSRFCNDENFYYVHAALHGSYSSYSYLKRTVNIDGRIVDFAFNIGVDSSQMKIGIISIVLLPIAPYCRRVENSKVPTNRDEKSSDETWVKHDNAASSSVEMKAEGMSPCSTCKRAPPMESLKYEFNPSSDPHFLDQIMTKNGYTFEPKK